MLPAGKILTLILIGNICIVSLVNGLRFRKPIYGVRSRTANSQGNVWKPKYHVTSTDDDDFEESGSGSGSGSGDEKTDIEDFDDLIITPKIKPVEPNFGKSQGVSSPVSPPQTTIPPSKETKKIFTSSKIPDNDRSQPTIPPSKETEKIFTTSKIPDNDRSSNRGKTSPSEENNEVIKVSENPHKPFPNKNTHEDSTVGTPAKTDGDGMSKQTIYIIVGSVVGGVLLVVLIALVVVRFSRKNDRDGYRHNLM